MSVESLCERFLRLECSRPVAQVLMDQFASGDGQHEFNFNLFDIGVDFEGQSVVIEDVLDGGAMPERLSLSEFRQRLARRIAD